MGKRIQVPEVANSGFGGRLAVMRKAVGFTQAQLTAEPGVSQRMVAYYEHREATQPAHLPPAMARALSVSIDELYGRRPAKRRLIKQEGDSRLHRRLLAIEKIDPNEKRQVMQLIDAFIEPRHLKRKVESRA